MCFEDMKIRVPKDSKYFLTLNYNKKCIIEIKSVSKKHYVIHEGIFDKKAFIPMQKWMIETSRFRAPNFYKFSLKTIQHKFGIVFQDYGVVKQKNKINKINYIKLCYELPYAIMVGVTKIGFFNTIQLIRSR